MSNRWLADAESPLTRLYALMTDSTRPSCTSALNAGR